VVQVSIGVIQCDSIVTNEREGTATATGTAASATKSGSANNLQFGGSVAGLAGLIAAIFAM